LIATPGPAEAGDFATTLLEEVLVEALETLPNPAAAAEPRSCGGP
jgi:hypothetical protein